MTDGPEFYFGEEEQPQSIPTPTVEQKPKEEDILDFAEQVQMGEQTTEAPKASLETPKHEDLLNFAEHIQQSVTQKVTEMNEAKEQTAHDTESALKSLGAEETKVTNIQHEKEELAQKVTEVEQETQQKIEAVKEKLPTEPETTQAEQSTTLEVEQPLKTERESLMEAIQVEYKLISEHIEEEEDKLEVLRDKKRELVNAKKAALNQQNAQKTEQIELQIEEVNNKITLIENGERPGNLRIDYYKKDKELYNQLMEVDKAIKELFKEDQRKNLTSTGDLKPGIEFPSKEYYAKSTPLSERAGIIRSEREQANKQFRERLSQFTLEESGLNGLENQREQLKKEYKKLEEEQLV